MVTGIRSLAVCVSILLCELAFSQVPRVRVGVVSDGPLARTRFAPELLRTEAEKVLSSDVQIAHSDEDRFVGDWTPGGIAAALDRALADTEVDVVLTFGLLSSHEAAHRSALPKPVIAPYVVDPVLQGYPLREGKSGRRNFSYVATFQSVRNEVRTFHRILRFKHLTALADGPTMTAIPELAQEARALEKELGVTVSIVRVENEVASALAAIPKDADAVYVTGLLRLTDRQLEELAQGLAARRLPSFSVVGRTEVEKGLLMTTGGAQRDATRLARRILLMIQRIAAGEDPATFEVAFPTEQRLAINMRVAREIGFSPRWEDLIDAEQVFPGSAQSVPQLSMVEAMRAALYASPTLIASRARADASGDDTRIARSNLLPQLDASGAITRIDADRANPLFQAEETTEGGLSLGQVIYSERAWAGYSIARHLQAAEEAGQRTDVLDTLQSVASAYLDVLRAKSLENVRRGNVENTRKNLETSRVREAVGLAERSDNLRWIAQLARDKQDLLAAESNRNQAQAELMRAIHRPASEPFTTVETGLDDPLALVANPRTQAFVETPAKWAVFTEYAVSSALERAPELDASEAFIAAQQRDLAASKRAYFLPDLQLVSQGSRAFNRSGAGSVPTPLTPDDDSWSVSIQASLPILTGRRRGAELSQARHSLQASQADRDEVYDGVEASARTVLHRTASSYPSIRLSAQAAAAADENLAMVSDAYARGVVSVTDLIDAQDTALESGLAAADAKYTFLVDFVGVLRATSDFDIMLDAGSREDWYRRIEDWFRTHTPSPQP